MFSDYNLTQSINLKDTITTIDKHTLNINSDLVMPKIEPYK